MAPLPAKLLRVLRRTFQANGLPVDPKEESKSLYEVNKSDTPPTEPSPNDSTYLYSPALSELPSSNIHGNVFGRQAVSSSPLLVHDLARRATQPSPTFVNGQGASSPYTFNNSAYMALFALVGAGMVLASIWFFFWAKHGGFVFRQGDWDDYKSTVLRRKGPGGRTLTNATKSTKLGQPSIAGTFSDNTRDDMVEVQDFGHRSRMAHKDKDVRDYRHEKPARVGGLNRVPDGSHFDYSHTNESDMISDISDKPMIQPPLKKEKGNQKSFMEKQRQKRQEKRSAKAASAELKKQSAILGKPSKHQRIPNDAKAHKATIHRPESETITNPPSSYLGQAESRRTASNSYYDEYRPNARPAPSYQEQYQHARRSHRNSPSHTPTSNRSRQSSPRKHTYSQAPGYFAAEPESRYGREHGQHSNRNTRYADDITEASYLTDQLSDTGTKVYQHHIPGLSKGSQETGRRGRDVMAGYRRGGAGRRDSLSDSEG